MVEKLWGKDVHVWLEENLHSRLCYMVLMTKLAKISCIGIFCDHTSSLTESKMSDNTWTQLRGTTQPFHNQSVTRLGATLCAASTSLRMFFMSPSDGECNVLHVSFRHMAHGWWVKWVWHRGEGIWMLLGLTNVHLEGVINAERNGGRNRENNYAKKKSRELLRTLLESEMPCTQKWRKGWTK